MKNKIDIQVGKALIEDKKISFMGMSSVSLNSEINWNENPFNNRTWMWHLHQMSYLKYLLEYERYYGNGDAIEYIMEILDSWFQKCGNDFHNEFAWHDHATAIRTQNLIEVYLFTKEAKLEKYEYVLRNMLLLHKDQLKKDSFYSRYTNHGLDQSLALYELTNVLMTENSLKKLAIQRVNDEIAHAFCSDGGHVENSPAYLNFGLKQVLEALEIGKKFEGEESSIYFSDDIFNKAILHLAFITQPNGKLPLIGDTKDFEVKNFLKNFSNDYTDYLLYSIRKGKQGKKPPQEDLVLTESGWAIFREHWEQKEFEKSTHIVFKCGFLSNYHRHDDDLHFVLFSDNEEWFIDGGEYKHAPKDPFRIYFRSADSHNLSKPYNLRAHRILEKSKLTRIKSYSHENAMSTIEAESYMFKGFKNTRKLSYDRNDNKIELHDICTPITKDSLSIIQEKYSKNFSTYITKFQLPLDKNVVIDANQKKVIITGKTKVLTIKAKDFKGNIKLVKGQKEPSIQGWRSQKSNQLTRAYTIEFYHKTLKLDQVFIIKFSDRPKKIIEVISYLKSNSISAEIFTSLKIKNLKYAFYLMYENEKIEQRWYDPNNKIIFNIDMSKDMSKYYVIGFIKDHNGKRYQAKSFPLKK